ASANQNRLSLSASQCQAQLLDDWKLGRHSHIKLQVSSGTNFFWGRTNQSQASSVFRGLRKKEIHLRQWPPEQRAPAAIAAQGAVRDARVHHRQPRACALCQPQQVRPELSLRSDYQGGINRAQVGADADREIERKIEPVLFAEALARQSLSGDRGGGDEYARGG